jgi:small subunit ribosomal protein S17
MKPRVQKKRVEGIVKSAAMDKTISVVVERLVKHRTYKKFVRKRSVLKAHDEKNEAKAGDRVQVAASRPLSKTKNWRLVRVVERASEG